jgi:hypothetical protein
VVWALRYINATELIGELSQRITFEPVLEIVEAPYRDNPRLAAQKGIFTLTTYRTIRGSQEIGLPSLDEVLSEYGRKKYGIEPQQEEWPLARRLTLPHNEARRLLRLLGEAGVNAATVFGDYDGARLSIEERRFWK